MPAFLPRIREIAAYCEIAGDELRQLQAQREQAARRRFLYSNAMDEAGLERWAASLAVPPEGMAGEDLLFALKAQLMDQRPYQRQNVQTMLARLVGEEGFRLDVDRQNRSVAVKLALSRENQKESVYQLLDRVLPAALLLLVGTFNTHGAFARTTHGTLSGSTYEQIRTGDIL